jgi:hypothetical protein
MLLQNPNRAMLTMGGPESYLTDNIAKDPPKSIHTKRRYQVYSDDMMHHVRSEPDRFSEVIQKFGRGKNYMASMRYGNHSDTTRSPYPIMRDGMFRFDHWKREELEPLSRQKYKEPPGRTNIGGLAVNVGQTVNNVRIDKPMIRGSIQPSAVYNMGQTENAYANNQVLDRQLRSEPIKGFINPTFSDRRDKPVGDAPSNIMTNPLNYAGNTNVGSYDRTETRGYDPINTRNRVNYAGNTNVGSYDRTETRGYDPINTRNRLNYAGNTNVGSYDRTETRGYDPINTRNPMNVSAQSNVRGQSDIKQNREYKLPDQMHATAQSNMSSYSKNGINGNLKLNQEVLYTSGYANPNFSTLHKNDQTVDFHPAEMVQTSVYANPSASLGELPDYLNPKTGIIIRPHVAAVSGYGNSHKTLSVANLDTSSVQNYIRDRDLQSYVTPVFNLVIAGANNAPTMLQLPIREKLEIVQRVNLGLPISIATPQGKIRLREYDWYMHQPTVSKNTTMVLQEQDSSGAIRNETPHAYVRTNIGTSLRTQPQPLLPNLDSPIQISVNSLPGRANHGFQHLSDVKLRDTLKAGQFVGRGHLPLLERGNVIPNLKRRDVKPIMGGGYGR